MTSLSGSPFHSWKSKLQIRQMEEADLPSLEWGGEYQHFRRLYAETYQVAREGRAILWVVELDGVGVIGQIFVQLNSARKELADGYARAYIYGFRIKPAYRNLGIGTKTMEWVEEDLRTRGYRWITLNVGRDNPEARRLYERIGYRVAADEPGRWSYIDDHGKKQDVHEPAWRMEKFIGVKRI